MKINTVLHYVIRPVTKYLDPVIFGVTPGPKFFEIFGPPLKYFIPIVS